MVEPEQGDFDKRQSPFSSFAQPVEALPHPSCSGAQPHLQQPVVPVPRAAAAVGVVRQHPQRAVRAGHGIPQAPVIRP